MGLIQNISNLFKSVEAKVDRINVIEFELEQISEIKDLLSDQHSDISKALSSDEFTCKEEISFSNTDYIRQLAQLKSREKSFLKELDILKSNEDVLHRVNENKRVEAVKIIKSLYREGKIGLSQYNEVAAEKDEEGATKYADVIVTTNKGEFLLTKRSGFEDAHQGAWVIPGGHVDANETHEAAAERELLEETGISLEKLQQNSINKVIWQCVGVYKDKNACIEYWNLHIADKTDVEILLDELETRDYNWTPIEEIDNYPMVFNMQENIKQFMGWGANPQLKIIRKAVALGIVPEDILEKALNHKYLHKEMKNGKWEYVYEESKEKTGFKYNLEVNKIDFVTNINQEYAGEVLSPFESKGSFKATIRKNDLTNILLDSEEFKAFDLQANDSIKSMCEKLKNKGVTKVEIYKNKFVFNAKPVKERDIIKSQKESLKGGESDGKSNIDIADRHGVSTGDIDDEITIGMEMELEHTDDPKVASEIVKDHLWEIPDYYTRLKKMEKEAKIEKSFDHISTLYLQGSLSDELYHEIEQKYEIEKGKKAFIGEKKLRSDGVWYIKMTATGDASKDWVRMKKADWPTTTKPISKVTFTPESKLVTVLDDDFDYGIFPLDIVDLLPVRSLGGSSDVKLMKYGTMEFAVKQQRDKPRASDQLKDERLADNIYRALGFATPHSTLISDDSGKDFKVSEMIEGKELSAFKGVKLEELKKEIRKGFVLDALLANWDVIGAAKDNILIVGSDTVYRIDNGSALRFRAKGSPKDSALRNTLEELETMRDASTNPSAAEIYSGVTDKELVEQMKHVLDHKDLILNSITTVGDSDLFSKMSNRIKDLQKRYDTLVGTRAHIPIKTAPKTEVKLRADMPSLITQNYFDKGWDTMVLEGNKEIKDGIKKQILEVEKTMFKSYDSEAKSMGMTVEEYKAEMQNCVEQMVKKADFFRATHCQSGSKSVLDLVFNADGRFKSQFEVGDSDGSYTPSGRSSVEHTFFAYPNSTSADPTKRPIYGYFSTSKNGVINNEGTIPPRNFVSSYGDVSVKIKKDSALKKATVCFDDSLGRSGRMACTPAAKPHFTSLGTMNLKTARERLNQKPGVTLGESGDYTEAQYHNQLTINDIESVHIASGYYLSKSTIDKDEAWERVSAAANTVVAFAAKHGRSDIKIKIF